MPMTLIRIMMARIAHRGGDHSYWRDEEPDIDNYLEEKLNDKSLWEIILVIGKEYRCWYSYGYGMDHSHSIAPYVIKVGGNDFRFFLIQSPQDVIKTSDTDLSPFSVFTQMDLWIRVYHRLVRHAFPFFAFFARYFEYSLAPTGAQEVIIFIPDHCLLRIRSPPSDLSLTRALNLNLSISDSFGGVKSELKQGKYIRKEKLTQALNCSCISELNAGHLLLI